MENLPTQPNTPLSTEFVDSLINELAEFQATPTHTNDFHPPRTQSAPQERQTQNPLSQLPASQQARVKPLMLTLHCLFPNDLLPALDILDRRLVQRFVRNDNPNAEMAASDHDHQAELDPSVSQNETLGTESIDQTQPEHTFFVMSASTAPPPGAHPSTLPTQELSKRYEVRLHAWNCTCPTFILSTFRGIRSRRQASTTTPGAEPPRDRRGIGFYPFGGTLTCATDRGSPICKHILASILFARCPGLFGGGGNGQCLVSKEELAGWCAGWGG